MKYRLIVFFSYLLSICGTALAQDAGTVTRLKGEASAEARRLTDGAAVMVGDRVRTGDGARLELRLLDGTVLTLGEHADVVLEAFLFDGAAAKGNAVIDVRNGAFLVSSGAIGKLPDRPLKVVTPVASIAIKGTKFWGGALENPLDVLVLEGAVVVRSTGGTVELDQPLKGTSVQAAGQAPDAPKFWAQERVGRAFATVSFE